MSYLFTERLMMDLPSSHADVFKFDNSYSWTRSKEVFYSLKILPPNVQPINSPAAGISHSLDDPSPTSSQAGEEEFLSVKNKKMAIGQQCTSEWASN